MEGVLALVRLYQKYTFSLNAQRHGDWPLEHESLITLMPKVSAAALCQLMLLLLLNAIHPERTMPVRRVMSRILGCTHSFHLATSVHQSSPE